MSDLQDVAQALGHSSIRPGLPHSNVHFFHTVEPPLAIRLRIRRIAERSGVADLLRPRILDVLGIADLDRAKSDELVAIESMLQVLTLYEPHPRG